MSVGLDRLRDDLLPVDLMREQTPSGQENVEHADQYN